MMQDHRKNSLEYWNEIHLNNNRSAIKTDDWLEDFDEIIMRSDRPILDLGCGSGNDTLYLISKGKQVIACDQSENAIGSMKRDFPEITDTRCFNMLDGLPFKTESFEIVIADLCLHYFLEKDTAFVVSEIQRILVPGGHLFLRVNSLNDVNHGAGQGKQIEHHVFETESGMIKRFFDEDDIRYFFGAFEIKYMKEEIMSRYRLEKRLFRVCAKKQEKTSSHP